MQYAQKEVRISNYTNKCLFHIPNSPLAYAWTTYRKTMQLK